METKILKEIVQTYAEKNDNGSQKDVIQAGNMATALGLLAIVERLDTIIELVDHA